MTAAFDPGPWKWSSRYEDENGKGDILISNNGKGLYICHLYTCVKATSPQTTKKYQTRRQANKALIAAAPDLYEAAYDAGLALQFPEGEGKEDAVKLALTKIYAALTKAGATP